MRARAARTPGLMVFDVVQDRTIRISWKRELRAPLQQIFGGRVFAPILAGCGEAHRRVLRARHSVVLAAEPTLSRRDAAHPAGLALGTVRKWRRRWTQEGWSLDDASRSGRPPTFPPAGRGCGQSSGL